MSPDKWAKLNKIIKNEMFRSLIIFYPLVLIFLFLFYPKFDQSYFILAAFFTVIWGYLIISNIKNPQEMIMFKEELNKKTPAEITKHMSIGSIFAGTGKILGITLLIMFFILAIFVIVFSLLAK